MKYDGYRMMVIRDQDRVRLRIMNRLAGFSSTATANTARTWASVRPIASVS